MKNGKYFLMGLTFVVIIKVLHEYSQLPEADLY